MSGTTLGNDHQNNRARNPAVAPAVSLTGVHKRYRTGGMTLAALQDVHAEIHADRFTVLSGPSGSGKTTLLNLVGGLDRPDQGRITVGGADIQALSDHALSDLRRLRIGFIFQNFNLLPTLTALENVEYPLLLNGAGPRERLNRARWALEEVGLADHGHQRPNQLSGGQQQRVAIARALVKRPLLVLADEPTANLDSETSRTILALMRTMQRRHQVAFVFSSHDPQVLAEADDIIAIKDGRVTPRLVPS